jgi:hypothetical protein
MICRKRGDVTNVGMQDSSLHCSTKMRGDPNPAKTSQLYLGWVRCAVLEVTVVDVDALSPVVFERRLASETAVELRPPLLLDDDDDSARRTLVMVTPRRHCCCTADVVVVLLIIVVTGRNRVEH